MSSRLVCHGCGYTAALFDPRPFRCPHAGDDVDHVLVRKIDGAEESTFFDAEPNPFVRYRRFTHAWHVATELGMSDGEFVALVRDLDGRVTGVEGRGFVETPLWQSKDGLWVKDERGNVAGSHKGRHLMGLMIWLEVARRIDSRIAEEPLAIASCGNAALAAAVIGRAGGRRLEVFVPENAAPAIVARLERLGAQVRRCWRKEGEHGDPAYLRFREAVTAGALPFTCQGPENGLVIEGGQTLGWEMVSQLAARGVTLDRLFVQVGGGALASACVAAFQEACDLGAIDKMPRIHAVQTAAASPLMRAWERVGDLGEAIAHRSQFMWPWETTPESIATGILDDETYDWVEVIRGMQRSGGHPVTVSEDRLREAMETGDLSATGAAGLAGLMELKLGAEENAAVIFTGARG
ncbi:MAG TPA: pyridoxal-phosphate dependent enzyme [Thermoanaerobaculia bacterium]|nr:pyridoxal-phosphate dependent enzyme [Thermoanaerobaculia bacterium]